jgi:hypothetical protein
MACSAHDIAIDSRTGSIRNSGMVARLHPSWQLKLHIGNLMFFVYCENMAMSMTVTKAIHQFSDALELATSNRPSPIRVIVGVTTSGPIQCRKKLSKPVQKFQKIQYKNKIMISCLKNYRITLSHTNNKER